MYTSTLASGATAILPLLASWSVSVPAALGLLAKGQGLKVRYILSLVLFSSGRLDLTEALCLT